LGIPFERAVSATIVRQLDSVILARTMESRHQIGLGFNDRFFPNQDTMPKGGFSNLIQRTPENEEGQSREVPSPSKPPERNPPPERQTPPLANTLRGRRAPSAAFQKPFSLESSCPIVLLLVPVSSALVVPDQNALDTHSRVKKSETMNRENHWP